MVEVELKKCLISFYLIVSLITLGFFGFSFTEDIIDNGKASRSSTAKPHSIIVDIEGNGDFTSIQEAINNADVGDTIYVWDGTYHEQVTVNKTVSLIGNGSSNTIIIGNGLDNVVYVKSNWVNISRFSLIDSQMLRENYCGIYLKKVNNVTIKNNNCSNNTNGIFLYNSDSNKIINNNCSNNLYGIRLKYSDSNLIINNLYQDNNELDISIEYCRSVIIYNNTISPHGLDLRGNVLTEWESHTIEKNNTVNSKPIYYLKNVNDLTIPVGVGEVILANCSNITIENQNNDGIPGGIFVGFSNNITINNITCNSNTKYGINIFKSDNNTISNCTLNDHRYSGIWLQDSDSNTIINNTCHSNNEYGGIRLDRVCNFNSIIQNNCSLNNRPGISIEDGESNIIINNTCNSNTYSGIAVGGFNHTIINNTLESNDWLGIHLSGTSYCKILNNTMISCGIYIGDAWTPFGIQNTIVTIESNNTVNGKPVYYWANITGGTVPTGAGQVILKYCSRVVVENQNCSDATYGIIISNSNNITIRNNSCNSNLVGIGTSYSENIIIRNNSCNTNTVGIEIRYSEYNKIYNNTCNYNEGGLWTYFSDSNIIENNTCEYNNQGITLRDSKTASLKNNKMISCGLYIFKYDTTVRNTHSIDTSNIVNGKPVYYWTNKHDRIVPPGAGQIFLINCSNVLVENQNCSDATIGIDIILSDHIKIRNNTCNSNDYGIFLKNSKSNTITNNTCLNNRGDGLYMWEVELNIVDYNNFSHNGNGIRIRNSENNKISENIIAHNSNAGIHMRDQSYDNIIYHNIIKFNEQQANVEGKRVWDYYGEGNYWSDYTGIDNDGDGIGDTELPHLGLDNYPVIEPYGWKIPRNRSFNDTDDEFYDEKPSAGEAEEDNLTLLSKIIILVIIVVILLILLLRRKRSTVTKMEGNKRKLKKQLKLKKIKKNDEFQR